MVFNGCLLSTRYMHNYSEFDHLPIISHLYWSKFFTFNRILPDENNVILVKSYILTNVTQTL